MRKRRGTGITCPLGRVKSLKVPYLKASLEDEPVTGLRRPETHPKMQRQLVAAPQVGRRIPLVPLLDLTERAVVLDAQRHLVADIEAGPRFRLELEFVLGARQVALEGGIEDQLQAA